MASWQQPRRHKTLQSAKAHTYGVSFRSYSAMTAVWGSPQWFPRSHLELPRTPAVGDGGTRCTLSSLKCMQHQRKRIPITPGNLQLHVHTTAAEACNASTELQGLPWRQLHACTVAAAVAVR